MIPDNLKALARRHFGENKSYREIAKLLNVAPNSVRNIILDNKVEQKKQRGPKSKVTRRQTISILREIGRIEDNECKVTATKIKQNCSLDHVSTRTVRRKLSELGYNTENADQEIQLTSAQKRKRVILCQQWIDSNWPWDQVIWTDEKRFSLDGPDSFITRCRKGKKPKRNRRQQGGNSLQFWGMILPNGELFLKELHQRSRSSDYIELLSGFAKPIIEAKCGENYTFQQDNASIHTSKQVFDWMRANNFNFMAWPARSPDLSPIENVWSMLSSIIYDGPQFKNVADLRKAIHQAVAKLNNEKKPQMMNLRNSIRARTRKVIECKGLKLDY